MQRIENFKKILLTVILLFTSIFSQNDYPIVLVHGFMGWGPDEMGSYNYWGGKRDMVQEFESQGFEVLVTNVGPISSNWDRAVELYYQIKGGQVDYGKTHSEKFGIVQKPAKKKYSTARYVDREQRVEKCCNSQRST